MSLEEGLGGEIAFAMGIFLRYTEFGVKAGSSIRQSNSLQICRLQVRFLSRLPKIRGWCKPTTLTTSSGEMAEWSIALVLKTRELTFRGFESLSLLHEHTTPSHTGEVA